MLSLHLLHTPDDFRPADPLQIRQAHYLVLFTGPVRRDVGTPETEILKRTAELCIEIDSVPGVPVAVAPAACLRRAFHPACDGAVIDHPDILGFRCAAYPPGKVYLDS